MKTSKRRKPGVQVKKYQIGGSVTGPMTVQESKRLQMLESGMFREGPNGSLLRQQTQVPIGLPPIDRVRELESLDRDMSEAEAREYVLRSFDPMAGPNVAFGMASSMSPAGAAVDVLGNVIGKGVGAVVNQGKNLMKFLLPKSEKTAIALDAAGKSAPVANRLGFATEEKIGEGYRSSQEVYNTRMREYFSPEGQNRMRNQLSDDLTRQLEVLENSLKSSSGAHTPTEVQRLKLVQKLKANVVNGKVSPTSKLVNDELDLANKQVRSVEFKPQNPEPDELVRGVGLPEEELMAMDAEYMELVAKREKGIKQYDGLVQKIEGLEQGGQYRQARAEGFKLGLLEMVLDRDYQTIKQLKSSLDAETGGLIRSGAHHHGENKEIVIGGSYLTNPFDSRRATAHEIQHMFQRPSSDELGILGRGAYGLDNNLQLNKELGELMNYQRGTFGERQAAKNFDHIDYYERAVHGTEIERGAFVAELRQDMVDKGFAKGSYDYEITPDRIKQYLEESYYKNSPRPGYRPENVNPRGDSKGKLRIVELFDFENPEVRKIVANAMQRLPAVLPAVGAAGAAAGSQDYRYGGKFKVLKK